MKPAVHWPPGFRERAQSAADAETAARVARAWGVPAVTLDVDDFTLRHIVIHPAETTIASGDTPAQALARALEIAP